MLILFLNLPYFLSIEDTKNIYPILPKTISEEVMFKTLIYYCNYNNNLPIPVTLLNICKFETNIYR